MIISCIGDSLTEGDYGVLGKSGIACVQERGYPYFLQKLIGGEVRNFGRCGYTASDYLERFFENNVRLENSDCVIIMLGTNGGLDGDDYEAKGNLDYIKLVSVCQQQAPSAKIILCTPPHATENMARSNYGYASRVKNAVKFVRAFAQKEGFALIDVASCADFCADMEDIMQPNDGLHFSEVGYYTLAKFIAENLQKWM